MYKKWTKFLIVVVICLLAETVIALWCFNSFVNDKKLEKGSIFVNLVEGWNRLTGNSVVASDENEYIEPFNGHFIYINKDAVSGKIVYGYELGAKYLIWNEHEMYDEDGNYKNDYEPAVAKDSSGKDLYVKATDRYYYATSTNLSDTYMYAKELGDQYFVYATDGNIELLTNDVGGNVVSGPKTEIPDSDVSFDKDAKFYYIIVVGSGVLSVASTLGLIIVAILKNKKASLSV